MKRLLLVLFVGCWVGSLSAQLETSLIIRSGMVIQRHQEIPIWGKALAGSKVFAELRGFLDSTFTTSGGEWEIHLPALGEGGPFELTVYSGNDTLRFNDVYVGDVWLASGQSNMQLELQESDNALQEISGADNQEIRQFLVTRSLGNLPSGHLPAGSSWTPATASYAGKFTAVGYYFAKYLYAHLNIPIGIINTSYGGTRIESWMSKEMLAYDEQNIIFGEGQSYLQPTVAYNTMLNPLTRVPIKGFLWYQGESNMGSREEAIMYSDQFKKLITSWRELWSLGDLPFIWVQIPNTGNEANENLPGTWDALSLLREAQSRVLSLPNTGEAITIDTGEPDIHPTNKEPVGERLALIARTVVYGDTIVSSGPRYKTHRKLGNGRVEITFDHVGSGLVAKETGDNALRWFSMVHANGIRYPANALIDSNKVVVWNNSIPNPQEIRYAWESNPFNINFYNGEELTAAPFRFMVNHPGFKIESFKSADYYIDKGESAVITWQIYGSSEAIINGLVVDTIGGWRVWPTSDSTFTIRAQNRYLPEQQDSVSIKIMVKQPDPTISLSTDAGEWTSPGSPVTVFASVSAPLGGTVSRVKFFVNGIMIDSVTQSPYETVWVPESAGEYDITGIVTNQGGLSKLSDTLKSFVYNLNRMQFEAENAQLAGGNRITDSDMTSGAQFVDLTRDWTVTFTGIEMEKDTESQLTIAYMVNYGSPRLQNLLVNGEFSTIIFEGPEEDIWKKYYAFISLRQGSNEISLKANWGYMSIDYISVESKSDSLNTRVFNTANQILVLNPNFPNPFETSTNISFILPGRGETSLEIYDMLGRKVDVIMKRTLDAGTHAYSYHSSGLEGGVYFLKLSFNHEILVREMLKF